MGENPIRVLCADDTDIAAEGMRRVLEGEPGIEVVGSVTRRNEVIRAVGRLRPDVLLLDLKWGAVYEAGRDMIREIRRRFPKVRVIAITVYESLVDGAEREGADAVVNKEIPTEDLIDRITAVAGCTGGAGGEKGAGVLPQHDICSVYEAGMRELLGRVGQVHPRHSEVLGLQQRLMENIHQFRRYGDTDARKAERAVIVDLLNELALEELGTSFNELSGLARPPT